jgi:protein-tyrosine phosphatase
MQVKVLFVCLGNICRSPTADGLFQKLVSDAGIEVPDPYHGGSEGFEVVLDLVEDAAAGLLKTIQANKL